MKAISKRQPIINNFIIYQSGNNNTATINCITAEQLTPFQMLAHLNDKLKALTTKEEKNSAKLLLQLCLSNLDN